MGIATIFRAMKFSKVAILGPGLIGGSIALALARRQLCSQIVLYTRKAATAESILRTGFPGVIFTDPAQAVEGAECVILCVPIHAMSDVATAMLPGLNSKALVTDVGSVKTPVVAVMEPLLAGRAHWVGSHPMAGRELSGFGAAHADLFVGASTILTPTAMTEPEAEQAAKLFWESLGSKVCKLTPEQHDARVAQVSHLTHLVSAALVNCVEPASLTVAGSGFRDTTRIAAGPPEMWTDILLSNREAVRGALDRLIAILEQERRFLESGNEKGLHTMLTSANEIRRKIS